GEAPLRVAPRRDPRGGVDSPPQPGRAMARAEPAIEKRPLTLRKIEIVQEFRKNELWHRGHRENAVYPKVSPRQVGLLFSCRVPGNSPLGRDARPHHRNPCNAMVARRF